MRLNLHILKEDLKHWNFDGILSDPPTKRELTCPVFCRQLPESVHENRLYILKAETLSGDVGILETDSILCIGRPSEKWLRGAHNLLYTEANITEWELMNFVYQRFDCYQQWADSLQEALDAQLDPQELAVRSISVMNNTIYVQGAFFRVLCVCVPPLEDTEFNNQYKKDYYEIQVGSVLNAEDINNLITDQEYNDAIHAVEPTIYSGELFGFRTLFHNIFIDNTFVARICIDEIVHSFTGKDFALIQIFGEYLKKRLVNSAIYHFDRPREMEEILTDLLNHRLLPEQKIQDFLDNRNWNVNDTYVCFIMKLKVQNTTAALEPLALQLAHIIMQDCYMIKDDRIVFVCNLTRMKITRDQLYSTILPYLRDNLLTAGISTTYRDFKNLYYYYHQAIIAEGIGQKKNPMHWYFKFEEYQLEYMIQKCTEKTIPEILIPEGLRTLMEYDRQRKHNYTRSLQLYLENDRNIAETVRAGYMHRNTFKYQLKRIQEILNMDLDDPDTRLLLLMTFRILNDGNSSLQNC